MRARTIVRLPSTTYLKASETAASVPMPLREFIAMLLIWAVAEKPQPEYPLEVERDLPFREEGSFGAPLVSLPTHPLVEDAAAKLKAAGRSPGRVLRAVLQSGALAHPFVMQTLIANYRVQVKVPGRTDPYGVERLNAGRQTRTRIAPSFSRADRHRLTELSTAWGMSVDEIVRKLTTSHPSFWLPGTQAPVAQIVHKTNPPPEQQE